MVTYSSDARGLEEGPNRDLAIIHTAAGRSKPMAII